MSCLSEDLEIGYLEGTLSDEEKAQVESHLKSCHFCRIQIEAAQKSLADFDSGAGKGEPIPKGWIKKALEMAEQERIKKEE